MKSNKGFSLVELIVVIAIMAIIAGVAIPVYTTYINKAEGQVLTSAVEEVKYAINLECTLKTVDKPEYSVDNVKREITITFADKDEAASVINGAKAVVADYFSTALATDETGLVYKGILK